MTVLVFFHNNIDRIFICLLNIFNLTSKTYYKFQCNMHYINTHNNFNMNLKILMIRGTVHNNLNKN